MLKLGDLEFEVESADLSAAFSEAGMSIFDPPEIYNYPEFVWFLEIDTEEGDCFEWIPDDSDEDEEPFYERAAPCLYHNNGFRMDVKSWKALEGMSKTWASECNEAGEEAGCLYVFEHEDVTSGRIEFLKREGNVFRVRWSGTANIFWNDEYGKDVPFNFEGDVTFSELLALCVDITDLDGVKEELSEYIDMNEFEFEAEEIYERSSSEDGTKKVHRFKFAPKF